MLDISNSTSSAFREPPGSATAALVPAFSMPPLAGGIGFARIGARFYVDGKPYIVRDDEVVTRKGLKDLKVIYRCLGWMRSTEMMPCACQPAKNFEALIAAHPSLDKLKEMNEVHILCAWSAEAWDEETHVKNVKQRDKFKLQLDKLEDDGRMLDAEALRKKLGWATNDGKNPERELVGLFMQAAAGGKWLYAQG